MKWIGILAMLSALGGCVAFSDNGYNLKVYDPGGREINTGLNLIAQGTGVYTARNGACSAYPGATVLFTDVQSGKELKPYKCRGTWGPGVLAAKTAGPNLWEDEVWKKPGAGKPAVRRALLECGAPNPRPEIPDMTDNEYMLMARCMAKAGFKNINGEKAVFQCKNFPDLPACRPGADIPSPSVSRRLNSSWCLAHKNNPECQR